MHRRGLSGFRYNKDTVPEQEGRQRLLVGDVTAMLSDGTVVQMSHAAFRRFILKAKREKAAA